MARPVERKRNNYSCLDDRHRDLIKILKWASGLRKKQLPPSKSSNRVGHWLCFPGRKGLTRNRQHLAPNPGHAGILTE